ncbi:adenylate kinase family protein [Candidatus Woesearchaeota archaeon]|nr:adenylate kinase family protein [Candidatus Woesearchaeota archaeon]
MFSQHKLIIITGTPGVGKSTLARKLVQVLGKGWKRLDLHKYYQEVSTGYDKKSKSYEIDLKKLEKLVAELKQKNNLIFDSHVAHLLPKKLVDLCIVLTCSDLKLLQRRLQKRKYSKAKVEENLQVEIFQTCLEEAKEKGQKLLVFDAAKEKIVLCFKKHMKLMLNI